MLQCDRILRKGEFITDIINYMAKNYFKKKESDKDSSNQIKSDDSKGNGNDVEIVDPGLQ